MELLEEITLYENKDTSEIVNMIVEKQSIYLYNNKIEAGKLFAVYYEKYLDRRLKIGLKRLELYRLRK